MDHGRELDHLGPRAEENKNLHPPIHFPGITLSGLITHVVEHRHLHRNATKNYRDTIHLNILVFRFATLFLLLKSQNYVLFRGYLEGKGVLRTPSMAG